VQGVAVAEPGVPQWSTIVVDGHRAVHHRTDGAGCRAGDRRGVDPRRPAVDVEPGVGRLVARQPDRAHGRGYYVDLALRITAGDDVELGDGGFTTWTAQLMATPRNAALVSCLSTERLATLVG
jgi:hypothetical protein